MSTHINAKDGQIAKTVLLPGDPLRAQFIAQHFLENPICYNQVRGMFGYTGRYNNIEISVQATGMGQPSLSIYATELITNYNVKNLIRVGTCGAIDKNVGLKELIIVQGACSDSALLNQRFGSLHFCPCASYPLIKKADEIASTMNIAYHIGVVATSDLFYDINKNYQRWAQYGVLAIEMECCELFTLAAAYKKNALAILTVSDHILTGCETSALEREQSFTDMIELALKTATAFT